MPSKTIEIEPGKKDMRIPQGELTIRTLAMPSDTNHNGDVFGGWVLGQMDIAGGIAAAKRAAGRVVTVAVDAMSFYRPVGVADIMCCYTAISRIGRTSIVVHIEAWTVGYLGGGAQTLVTEGTFTYVAIDASGRPKPLLSDQDKISAV